MTRNAGELHLHIHHRKLSSKMNTPPFWNNLPSEITANILSRLPIKTILICKCVCKHWLELLSTPEFAQSHFCISTPGLAVQKADKMCKIFEFEDGLDLQRHDLHYNPVMQFSTRGTFSRPNANSWIRGSVNGLLLFHDFDNALPDSLYICNPITHEYISLPKPQGIVEYPDIFVYGFGVSAITCQYKVVRIIQRCPNDCLNAGSCSIIQNYECLVYTVGTGSWRRVPSGAPFGNYHLWFSVFLNGNLHGLVAAYCGSLDMLIYCFDLETELFKPFPPPPPSMEPYSFGSLGVLDDCLCFVDSSEEEGIVVIWVMKEYGVEKSWTKLFVVVDAQYFIGGVFDAVYAIKAFNDGDILLHRERVNLFYYSSKNKTCQELDLFAGNPSSVLNAILYKPSLVSLKSFHGENVKLFS